MMSAIILKVERPAYGGCFIGRHNGKVVMISGAVLPGETIEAAVEAEKKDYIKAAATRILEPSPFRIEPACKYYGTCGGCQLQHVPYEIQVKLKQEILLDCLKRQAKIETALSDPVFDATPWNYRLRGQFKMSSGKIGFYKENSREVVDIDNCPLMDIKINEYLKKIRAAIKDIDVNEIHITCGEDAATALIKTPKQVASPDLKLLESVFLGMGFSGLCVETHNGKIFQSGKFHITLNLNKLKYTVSPRTFFQSHWSLNQVVTEIIENSLQPLKGKKVLDLYSGAGNFSIPLAADAEVTAVEENPYAIEDGKRNIEINKIKNCRFINSSAEGFHTGENFDIIILDPPRAGISNTAMNAVLTLAAERIVYISCNPSTLARDLKKLLNKYHIESVRIIDFFPQTSHIESLALLRLN